MQRRFRRPGQAKKSQQRLSVYLAKSITIRSHIRSVHALLCTYELYVKYRHHSTLVPICVSIATEIGADPSAVLMACVIGGSCAYATPIGMPANTMVITAGGYTFKDYAKAGIPLIVVATIVSMVLLPIFYPFFP